MVCADTSSAAKTGDATTAFHPTKEAEMSHDERAVSWATRKAIERYGFNKAIPWYSWAEVAELTPRSTGPASRRFHPHLPERRSGRDKDA